MARAKHPKHKQHQHAPISQKQVRKSAREGAVRIGVKHIEVRKAVSQRGRTHQMEAPLPGMPEGPQEVLLASTAIKRFKYYVKKKRLRIWFMKGGVYDYYGVPEGVVLLFAQAQSKGRFFVHNIRTSYDYKRIR